MDFVNLAVPWGEVLIGLALIVGRLARLAAFWGAFLMLMSYLGNWDIDHGYTNGDFAYILAFLSVAAFGAGRILGPDAYIEQYDVGGEPLVERYPWTRYFLGQQEPSRERPNVPIGPDRRRLEPPSTFKPPQNEGTDNGRSPSQFER